MGKKPRPSRPAPVGRPASSAKATRLPGKAAPSSGGGGGGAPRRRPKSPRSVWGLLALAAALAASLAAALAQRREARRRGRATLARLARKPLAVTEHAACRMRCRFVARAEVDEALATGDVNAAKSAPDLRPCPKVVVDARVGPRAKAVQLVLSDCPGEARLLTVIDTDTDWPCPPC